MAEKIMNVPEKLSALRAIMKEKGVDAYLVPTGDFHGSEYGSAYFGARRFMSDFTGSAGTLVVMHDKAGLWTDGRYFLQAGIQLEGTTIDLYKDGEPGVPSIGEFLAAEMPENGVLGFDGRVMMVGEANDFEKTLASKNITFAYEEDFVGYIWEDRPSLPDQPAWLLPIDFAGEHRKVRIEKVREGIKNQGADALVLTSLDDIAWLFNIRGDDVRCNPVVLSYAYIDAEQVILFADENKFDDIAKEELAWADVKFMPYNDVYEFIKGLGDKAVLIDDEKVNYAIIKNLENAGVKIVYGENPTFLLKAVKNPTEIEHMKATHIDDGVAVTKFIYWLKHRDRNETLTEIDLSDKLEEIREMNSSYIGPSFETIAGYGPNGAIIHYGATEETNATLENKGFVLVDTGGQYWGGTTDITRTISLGALTDDEKKHYTAVLRGHLGLAAARFPEGMKGINLDAIARKPIWDVGCDYKHGTGHGIGYMLNVHEGPNSIRNAVTGSHSNSGVMVENMITSNEPGIYIAGSHGIRIETLVLTVRETEATDVPMLKFETLTLVPYDRDAIVIEQMTADEIKTLNDYHKHVYDTISPLLTAEEAEWLKAETAPF